MGSQSDLGTLVAAARSDHPGLNNTNADWLRLVGPDLNRPIREGLVCSLWVLDQTVDRCVVKWIDVFSVCLRGCLSLRLYYRGCSGPTETM